MKESHYLQGNVDGLISEGRPNNNTYETNLRPKEQRNHSASEQRVLSSDHGIFIKFSTKKNP